MRNGNEAETVRDTAITLFINSVTGRKQLVTENIIDMQLIDVLNGSTLLDELLINSDNNVLSMEVIERAKQIKMALNCWIIFPLQQGWMLFLLDISNKYKISYSTWRWGDFFVKVFLSFQLVAANSKEGC